MADASFTRDWAPVRGVVSDLDGVIYRGKAAIPDAVAAFQAWQAGGLPFCFVTNNSTHTAEDVVRKLGGFGLRISTRDVVTSAVTAARLIRRTHPAGARVSVVGAPSLIQAMLDAELDVTEADPQVVVMGLDREITHEKMKRAVNAVLNGATLIGTNPDLLLPTDTGFEPGAGAVLAAVAAATRMKPVIVGKPEVHMIEEAIARLGTDRASTIMIGDQIPTDIQAGKRAGLRSVLVTTGVPPVEDASLAPPDLTLASLRDLPLGQNDGKMHLMGGEDG